MSKKLNRGARKACHSARERHDNESRGQKNKLKENVPANGVQKKDMRNDKKQRNAIEEKETKRTEVGTRGEKKMEKE